MTSDGWPDISDSVPRSSRRSISSRSRASKKSASSSPRETCQFLGADRTCTVYEARPTDCRGYVCWDQDDTTVYDYARFMQLPVAKLRKLEREEEKAEA